MEIFREGKIEIKIKRYSSSKKLRLISSGSGDIRLTAPKRASFEQIHSFIRQNTDWIQSQTNNQQTQLNKLRIDSGETLSILGLDYKLIKKTLPSGKLRIYLDELQAELLVFAPESYSKEKLREEFKNKLKDIAKEEIWQNTTRYSALMRLPFAKLRVREQKTRWGSCSSKGNLNFNWKLLLAPARVMNYVIVHELAHLEHPNHSKEFWKLVEQYHPSYKQDRNWLKENAMQLEVI
ncbi:MAG: M48 family metallopeptidase [Candidatus Dojkabacteria bacterium]